MRDRERGAEGGKEGGREREGGGRERDRDRETFKILLRETGCMLGVVTNLAPSDSSGISQLKKRVGYKKYRPPRGPTSFAIASQICHADDLLNSEKNFCRLPATD